MYIFEILFKAIYKLQRRNSDKASGGDKAGLSGKAKAGEDFEMEYQKCEHIFMPIDSTGEVLACSKCGKVLYSYELKEKKNNL